jgi:hypothetical protein
VTDPRLLRWLDVTEQALKAPAEERAGALVVAHQRREELQRSLLEDPPSASPDPDLRRRLEETESALSEIAAAERVRLGEALQQVRRQKTGTAGYRPARPHTPAFVSRKA